MSQSKITVKLYGRLLTAINRDFDALFLKRDAFLNQLLAGETEYLAKELAGKKLSARGHRYIAGELKRLGTIQANLVVDKQVADALNAVVKDTNMVRDAFVNRLLWFLRAGPTLLDYLDLPQFLTSSAFTSVVPEFMPTAPLEALRQVQRDPFHSLRAAAEERHETGLYLLPLPPKLHGFECWLPDESIPGTAAFKDPDSLLAELEALDKEAFRGLSGRSNAGNGGQP